MTMMIDVLSFIYLHYAQWENLQLQHRSCCICDSSPYYALMSKTVYLNARSIASYRFDSKGKSLRLISFQLHVVDAMGIA